MKSGPVAEVIHGAEPASIFDAGSSDAQVGVDSQCEGAGRDLISLTAAEGLNTGTSAGSVERQGDRPGPEPAVERRLLFQNSQRKYLYGCRALHSSAEIAG